MFYFVIWLPRSLLILNSFMFIDIPEDAINYQNIKITCKT